MQHKYSRRQEPLNNVNANRARIKDRKLPRKVGTPNQPDRLRPRIPIASWPQSNHSRLGGEDK